VDPFPLLIFVGSVAILVGAVALDQALARRRSNSCRHAAEQLGLRYENRATPFAGTDVSGLWFFDAGASSPARNVMNGSAGAYPMVVFDLTLFNPTEMASETTFAAFRRVAGRLPVFQLGAKHTLEHVREALAPRSLPLADPEFTRKFYVHSADASLARFLTRDKLARLRQYADDYRIESSPDWLIVYRAGVRVRTSELAQFIAEARAIAEALLAQGPDVSQPAAVG
jgi:hypothetical protein